MDRTSEPGERELPDTPEKEQPSPSRQWDIGDADDVSVPIPALDPPDAWPDPEVPVTMPERELA